MTRQQAFRELKHRYSPMDWVVVRWATRFGHPTWTVESKLFADKALREWGMAEVTLLVSEDDAR